MGKRVYLIGSLRNKGVPILGSKLRALGMDVFDDWHAGGPEADDEWRRYHVDRGDDYQTALRSFMAEHVFEFDKKHLDRCDMAVMLMPAGRSGHLEFGYMRGSGKTGYILFDKEPERWDVMVQFATDVYFSEEKFLADMEKLYG